jgi:uroporphyrin-III C-methyltransferase
MHCQPPAHTPARPATPAHAHRRPQVTLVGAGPGDPELLTLKAVKAIGQADTVFIDDLVNPEVLTHAGAHARIIHVGKRGGCASTPQAFIEKAMVAAALQGQSVVRLKGGDPFVFGRGGEEIDALERHGISVTVVPGITAGMAALTTLNTPLTHRDCAQGVVFVTGHAKAESLGPNWAQLADTAKQQRLTLVVYMGMSHAQDIADGLMQGLSPSTPVAVVQHATLPHQRHVCCTLNTMAHAIASHGLGSPAVLVIGEVTRGLLSAATQQALAA